MAKRRPSGDGMVRKREDGRWEGRIVVGHKDNGDSIFRYVYADTQKELTARLRKCITAYQGVDLTEECRMTLSEWLDRWLEQMASVLRPSTLEHYRSDMEHHVKPYLGQKKLTQITASDLRKLYDDLKKQGRVHPRPGQGGGVGRQQGVGLISFPREGNEICRLDACQGRRTVKGQGQLKARFGRPDLRS